MAKKTDHERRQPVRTKHNAAAQAPPASASHQPAVARPPAPPATPSPRSEPPLGRVVSVWGPVCDDIMDALMRTARVSGGGNSESLKLLMMSMTTAVIAFDNFHRGVHPGCADRPKMADFSTGGGGGKPASEVN